MYLLYTIDFNSHYNLNFFTYNFRASLIFIYTMRSYLLLKLNANANDRRFIQENTVFDADETWESILHIQDKIGIALWKVQPKRYSLQQFIWLDKNATITLPTFTLLSRKTSFLGSFTFTQDYSGILTLVLDHKPCAPYILHEYSHSNSTVGNHNVARRM